MTLDCGHEPSEVENTGIFTGYGQDSNGKKHCYACIAEMDRKTMIETGHSRNLPLYWGKQADGQWWVANWPGSLKFKPLRIHEGKHNIGGTRDDVWFDGPDGHVWHGVQIGQWNQILHAKRTKELSRKAA